MRKTILRWLTILSLLATAFTLTAWAVSFVRQQPDKRQPQGGAKRKTLRELARERDVEIDGHSETGVEYSDLHTLAKDAEAIVFGRVLSSESCFDGEDHIITTYQLEVKSIIKGGKASAPPLPGYAPPAPLTTPLKIVRFGGAVNVNGHRASVKLNNRDDELIADHDYIFFLFWGPSSEAYYPAGGFSGIFSVGENLRVRSLASAEHFRRAVEGLDLETFISRALK